MNHAQLAILKEEMTKLEDAGLSTNFCAIIMQGPIEDNKHQYVVFDKELMEATENQDAIFREQIQIMFKMAKENFDKEQS